MQMVVTATDAVGSGINLLFQLQIAGTDKVICNGASTVNWGKARLDQQELLHNLESKQLDLSKYHCIESTGKPTVDYQFTVTVTSGVGCSSTDVVQSKQLIPTLCGLQELIK